MSIVFVGGSRRISRLDETVRTKLDRIVEKKLRVLIGDASGVDKTVQQYLCDNGHQNVEVFCSGTKCRNNVGRWPLRMIPADARIGLAEFYSAKDRVMAEEATVGLMIWDGKSAGTLLNIFRLVSRRKVAVVYHAADRRFFEIRTKSEWDDLIARCAGETKRRVTEGVAREETGADKSAQLVLSIGHHRPAAE